MVEFLLQILQHIYKKVEFIFGCKGFTSFLSIQNGHAGIEHPSLPSTEAWIFVVMVLLLVMLAVVIFASSATFSELIQSVLRLSERENLFGNMTTSNTSLRFFLSVFSTLVFSFYVYFYYQTEQAPFSFVHFSSFWGVTVLFFLLKSILLRFLGFVFLNPTISKIVRETYFNILFLTGVLLYPLLFTRIYAPPTFFSWIDMISLIVFLSGFFLIVVRIFQIFSQKIIAFFYILLYLCTLEILPYIALIKIYESIV